MTTTAVPTTTRALPTSSCPPVLVGVCRATWPARWRRDQPRPLRHAVETHRCAEELDDEPELALCGAFVAVTGLAWTTDDPDCCPECERLLRDVAVC